MNMRRCRDAALTAARPAPGRADFSANSDEKRLSDPSLSVQPLSIRIESLSEQLTVPSRRLPASNPQRYLADFQLITGAPRRRAFLFVGAFPPG